MQYYYIIYIHIVLYIIIYILYSKISMVVFFFCIGWQWPSNKMMAAVARPVVWVGEPCSRDCWIWALYQRSRTLMAYLTLTWPMAELYTLRWTNHWQRRKCHTLKLRNTDVGNTIWGVIVFHWKMWFNEANSFQIITWVCISQNRERAKPILRKKCVSLCNQLFETMH